MIIHIIKEKYLLDDWESYDENGKCLGVEEKLSKFRNIFGKLHRGINYNKLNESIKIQYNLENCSVYRVEKD